VQAMRWAGQWASKAISCMPAVVSTSGRFHCELKLTGNHCLLLWWLCSQTINPMERINSTLTSRVAIDVKVDTQCLDLLFMSETF
jgi:hypothetical protein